MKRRTALAMSVLVLAVTTFAACAEASGEIRGGEQLVDTTPAAFIGCDETESVDAGTGTKWSDLYRDLFGPTSAAKCATATCHGKPDGAGVKASGFECLDEKACRLGMVAGVLNLVQESDRDAPERSKLFASLRHCDDERRTVGGMPKSPRTYYFSKASIARIQDWIRAGAKDD